MKFLLALLLAAIATTPGSGRLTTNNNNNWRRQARQTQQSSQHNRRESATMAIANNINDPRSVERKALAPEVDILGSLLINTERHLRNMNHNVSLLMVESVNLHIHVLHVVHVACSALLLFTFAFYNIIYHMQLYPECVDQGSAATCLATLKAICETDPTRFPNLDTGCASLHAVVETTRDINSPNYNYVGIIPDPTGTYAVGPHGNCLQHYELPWMIRAGETDVGPFDCTDPAGATEANPTGCLPMEECCDVMHDSGIPQDDRGNALQCYIFPTEQAYEDADPDRVRLVVDRFTGQVRAARIFHSPHSA